MVEWPSAKKKPTLSGRWPSAISFRVVLSIAAMWSASKAWRTPERVGGDPDAEAERSGRAEAVFVRGDERDQDEEADTVSPRITNAISATVRHSRGLSADLIRPHRITGTLLREYRNCNLPCD